MRSRVGEGGCQPLIHEGEPQTCAGSSGGCQPMAGETQDEFDRCCCFSRFVRCATSFFFTWVVAEGLTARGADSLGCCGSCDGREGDGSVSPLNVSSGGLPAS